MSDKARFAWAGAIGVVLLALPVRSPVVSVLTGEPVPGVSLHFPAAYLLLAPVCSVLDFLTLLTIPEHLAILGALTLVFLVWRVVRRRKRRRVLPRIAIEVGSFVACLAGLLAVYAFGAVGPRPMAKLEVTDPNIVVVDFHSHTASSHDGRKSFTAPVNRAWHRDAGFDAAWITDHDSIGAGQRAEARNPATAGQGMVLLTGREVVYRNEHVAVLGTVDPRITPVPGDSIGAVKNGGVRTPNCSTWPVIIQTIPENLDHVPTPGPGGCPVVHAIEISDGAPKGIDQGERDKAEILHIADSLHLVPVASSNNHGWGRTAVAWNLIEVPGWRAMTPHELGARIETALRTGDPGAVEVVARRRQARTDGGMRVASPLMSAASFLGGLTRPERLGWLIWVGLGWLILRRRSASRGANRAEGPSPA